MKLLKILFVALFATLASTSNAAIVIVTDTTTVDSIPGLTGFATSGAQMDGLKVTANFSGGLSQTLSWADTGATSGGVTGDGWALSLTGDSYSNVWEFVINPDLGQLLTFVLDASGPNQITVFDTLFGGAIGTNNSDIGRDFDCGDCGDVVATYTNVVAVTPDPAVGDTFHTLSVAFLNQSGPRSTFYFSQDTDNDERLDTGFVPEPGTMPMILLALAGMGLALRRRN